jgi:hypothetical protein
MICPAISGIFLLYKGESPFRSGPGGNTFKNNGKNRKIKKNRCDLPPEKFTQKMECFPPRANPKLKHSKLFTNTMLLSTKLK